ncbi:uncharacterized protein PV07_06299 [Cladophialophora immunda]|uniref:Pyruvate decarboxylase n=1 Tax=Cladophialophora immunda TaxID=569365 RepID=A0A0D2AZ61_9EURO|nr:uncharacterized protein PV07_06299 [Cladophialophora immunda]KIW30562.1 hypothetical protein PV07_06299 [Cladophialophora immunda]OQU97233.1 Thiamine pyrophosphate enzyme, TPP binding domain-containing protein [Cladophialophora immunda]
MSQTTTVAEYLFTRLRQLGVGAVHGVPGDYNLRLLDYVVPSGLLWVGNANELNAGYATDGYARIKGIGALVTTYGVGELSAINAIACAFTERAAVVHIVGTPPRNTQASRLMVHHTLGDGDYRHFGQMQAHVTVAQTNLLDPRTAPQQIDQILEQCILHCRPVYIEVPLDMVSAPVVAERLSHEIAIPRAVPNPAYDVVLDKILEKMYAAKQPLVLVDGEARALGILDQIERIVSSTVWPTFTTTSGKGLINETLPNVHGIYRGSFADAGTKAFIDGSDLALYFGPHLSSTNTYNWTGVPQSAVTIYFTWEGIKIGDILHRDISPAYALAQILQKLDLTKLKKNDSCQTFPSEQLLSFSEVSKDERIKQDKVWRLITPFLRPGDIVFGETGTAGYGVREMLLPKHTRLFTPITWLSIGYMLPASQGAALAQRELIASSKYHDLAHARTILFIGDGSLQMTVQELATIIRHNLNVIVFLINNDGYTIERCIHGLEEGYNDISTWRYLKAPSFFGAPENAFTASTRTYGELEQALNHEKLADGTGLRMVEIHMDRYDAPAGPLTALLNQQNQPQGVKV